MKTLLLLAIFSLAISSLGRSQELKIDDKVPDFNIGNIINHSKQTLRFSDIKSRLVILDYWSVGCIPCIYAMPKMDSLQKKFGSSIFILPITTDKVSISKPFWLKNKYTNSTSLPTVLEDTIRKKYFSKSGWAVPFEVWILDGRVIAFSGADKVNEKEIREVLSGIKKNWPNPYGYLTQYKTSLTLTNGVPTDDNSTCYSMIVRSKPLNHATQYDNLDSLNRINTRLLFINYPILNLYSSTFNLNKLDKKNEWMNYFNRIILEVKDVKRYMDLPNENVGISYHDIWLSDNTYCYETIIPGKVPENQIRNYLIADFDKFFGLRGRIEKRKRECWILTLKPDVKKVKDFTSTEYNKKEKKLEGLTLYNSKNLSELLEKGANAYNEVKVVSTENLIYHIDIYNAFAKKVFNPPIIDETRYAEAFNITMKLPNYSVIKPEFSYLKAELNKYGFDLVKGVREIEMLVISENYYQKEFK